MHANPVFFQVFDRYGYFSLADTLGAPQWCDIEIDAQL